MLAIELDSYAWHMNRAAFEVDRMRDNELRALGWVVFRFTYAMLRWDEHRVAHLIRDQLLSTSAYEGLG
jgi:very-short-patch-repair endonuclease